MALGNSGFYRLHYIYQYCFGFKCYLLAVNMCVYEYGEFVHIGKVIVATAFMDMWC